MASNNSSHVSNKGTGAGGANTNHNGNAFENKTDNESRLLSIGFIRKNIPGKEKTKYGYYLELIATTATIIFVKQNGLKNYMKSFHNKEVCREVDEAYIIKHANGTTLKILEKKNQNGGGSVEDKLCLGHHFKFIEFPDYVGPEFQIEYAFCISSFLKECYISNKTKWPSIRHSNEKYDIPVLFGDDEDYFTKLDEWINRY
jgi:hypothetical protein